jgi:hypothetical protein
MSPTPRSSGLRTVLDRPGGHEPEGSAGCMRGPSWSRDESAITSTSLTWFSLGRPSAEYPEEMNALVRYPFTFEHATLGEPGC